MNSQNSTNWVYQAQGDVNRIEACYSGAAFSPHRHDTYAFGVTLAGVQSFDYMGATRHSLPGGVVVLHPDELHDGRAGTDTGFRYRTIYIEPSAIQVALGGKPLPFIESGVSSDQRLLKAVHPLLENYDEPLNALELQDAIFDLATVLDELAGASPSNKSHNYLAAERARQYILERLELGVTLDELELATGHDRWQLSRDFRALFGTSPYRYLIMRRLERAQKMLLAGSALADTASACAFADQSHLTRAFKKAFGVTPKAWANALAH